MKTIKAKVVSVHCGEIDKFHKDEQTSIIVELDGIVGDRHRSFKRETWDGGDKQPAGTERRNERQWSAASLEELAEISEEMDLAEPLQAGTIGVDLCIEGVPELSRLPKGSLLKFPSGAELQVEEFNPPCLDMGKEIASSFKTRSGNAIEDTAFSKAAKLKRGLVGIVEVAGIINPGDEVEVTVYEHPSWLARTVDD